MDQLTRWLSLWGRVLGALLLVVTCATSVHAQFTLTDLGTEGEGDGAGAGDLRLTEGCQLGINGNGWINGDLNIQVAGQPAESYYFESYIQDYMELQVYTTVPAANSNRNVVVGRVRVGATLSYRRGRYLALVPPDWITKWRCSFTLIGLPSPESSRHC